MPQSHQSSNGTTITTTTNGNIDINTQWFCHYTKEEFNSPADENKNTPKHEPKKHNKSNKHDLGRKSTEQQTKACVAKYNFRRLI